MCVPVCVSRASELPGAIERATRVADIVELRLDCLGENEREAIKPMLPALLDSAGTQVIVTLRSAEQGGHTASDYATRRSFWSLLEKIPVGSLVDLELDLVSDFATEGPDTCLPIDWNQVICSHHDFGRVPLDLEQIYERMAAAPARILKIAIQAHDATDCLPGFRLLERAHREGREIIAIAMGTSGIMTRILGPSRGSFLTDRKSVV